ncbi:unnamed protein product, partial [Laminaria digitata]
SPPPLPPLREKAMKRFAEGFLTLPWCDPSELHGCGRFASDSWQIFCLGRGGGGNVKKSRKGNHASLDRNLAAYCRFAERRASSGGAEGGGGGGGGRGAREGGTEGGGGGGGGK